MLKEAYRQGHEYECQVLQGIATVELFGLTSAGATITPENNDPRIPFGATSRRMTCHNRDECGIRRGEINGTPDYDWGRCPAYQTLSETGSLPTTKRDSNGSS